MSLVRKKKERSGGGGAKTRVGPSPTCASPPHTSAAIAPHHSKPFTNRRQSAECQKENPPPPQSRKNGKEAAPPRSVSRGRALSVRTAATTNNNNNSSLDSASSAHKSPPKTVKPRQTTRSGVRNPGRPTEDPRKIAKEEGTNLRWSTSSLPSNNGIGENGKKSSESSISRIISDMQRERRSRVSQKPTSAISASYDGIECLGDARSNPGTVAEATKKPEHSQEKKILGSNSVRNTSTEKDGSSGKEGNGFPSKLHERLAFLEGRVNQIASELRKTKEMLDANKTESSKTMLSDIQLKINGIERAMTATSAADDVEFMENKAQAEAEVAKPQLGKIILQESYASVPSLPSDVIEKRSISVENEAQEPSNDNVVASEKNPVKRLNRQEWEDRFFPHQKLLRSRSSVQLTALKPNGDLHDQPPNQNQNENVSSLENAPLSPIDEDPIAAEFLSALSQKHGNSSDDKNTELKSTESGYTSLEGSGIRPGVAQPISNGNGSENGSSGTASSDRGSVKEISNDENEPVLECDEELELDDQENNQPCACITEEIEEAPLDRLNQIGHKTSTAGWFVSEGESILLAHDDGACSFHDIANSEEKAEYKAPHGLSPNIWGDCWLIRAAGPDGRAGKYVVAASAGSTLDSGFCSWDFYNKEIVAFHTEEEVFGCPTRSFSSALTERTVLGRNSTFANVVPENQHWWYRPCGPLLVGTATSQKMVSVYDIRDGDHVMNWETQRNVMNMNYSSPLQWRNKGKVVVAETEAISLWDVNSLDPRPLHCVSFPGRKVSALHVHNTDAECNGGVRQRISSSEAEGNDGVFCTQDAVCVCDFRVSSGVGLKIPTFGENGQSIFARGDSIFAGVVNTRFSSKVPVRCRVHQWSIRKGKPVCVYTFPESNAHFEQFSVAQVWGSLNMNLVMAVNGNGLFIFDACNEDGTSDHLRTKGMREVIGPDDLYCPSFDYSGSRILLVSKDRPACWRYWS